MPSTAQRRSIALFTALALCCGLVCAAPAAREESLDFGKLQASRITLQQEGTPDLRYVISRPAQKAPLVLYIQGSGCIPPFTGLGTPHRSSTIFSWVPLAQTGRYAVMAVDKPYQPDGMPDAQPGSALGCPKAFNDYFSYDRWLASLVQAVRHAATLPWVDTRRVLVIGISEGATMAASADNLAQAKARVYLASGMQDNNVPILSTEVLYAQLRAQGRDVAFRRVPTGNHSLQPDGVPLPEVQKEYDAIMAWFQGR